MALGTMTRVSNVAANGPVYCDEVTLVGDGSYPTGGSTGLKAKLQALTGDLREPFAVIVQHPGGSFSLNYDHANEKLQVRAGGTLAEVANLSDQSAVTYKLCILSK